MSVFEKLAHDPRFFSDGQLAGLAGENIAGNGGKSEQSVERTSDGGLIDKSLWRDERCLAHFMSEALRLQA